jgi:hypothetical protein
VVPVADPVAELSRPVLAIEKRHGLIIRIMLGKAGWDADGPAGSRVVRLGWFGTIPAELLTAIARVGRTDLLTVPPHAGEPAARAAMDQAAQAGNRTRTPPCWPPSPRPPSRAARQPAPGLAPHRTVSS